MKALDINGLRKVYPNEKVALHDISLSIQPGDFFGFLGENGAGKSTTIGIITSLIKKTAGTVNVFGYDLDNNLQQVKGCIGVVPQEINFNIFESVMQVLVNQAGYYGVPSKEAETRAEYYLKKLGLWDQRYTLGMHLSGGMKRRVMLVRALIHLDKIKESTTDYPGLLILDEPTAGIDVELRRIVWGFLKKLNERGITIMLTTHYLEEAENLCKHIAIIDEGRVIKQMTTQALISQMNIQTFVCDLSKAISSVPQKGPFILRLLQANHIEVDVKPDQTINQLFQYLQSNGIEVVSLRNKSNRLESIFLDLINTNHSKSD